jgi:hypothetical protein
VRRAPVGGSDGEANRAHAAGSDAPRAAWRPSGGEEGAPDLLLASHPSQVPAEAGARDVR